MDNVKVKTDPWTTSFVASRYIDRSSLNITIDASVTAASREFRLGLFGQIELQVLFLHEFLYLRRVPRSLDYWV
jgi:hypothetical protein